MTHQDLTLRAGPDPSAQHVSVGNFMNSPRYDEIVEEVKTNQRSPRRRAELSAGQNRGRALLPSPTTCQVVRAVSDRQGARCAW